MPCPHNFNHFRKRIMSQILYYISSDSGTTELKALKKRLSDPALGLTHIVADIATHRPCKRGPCENGPGLVFTLKQHYVKEGAEPSLCGYHPDRQRWISCNNGAFCIGIETDRTAPRPIDLGRPDPLAGHLVKLDGGTADDEQFSIPYSRNFSSVEVLPKSMGIGPDGAFCMGEVLYQFKTFSDLCGKLSLEFWTARGFYDAAPDEIEQMTYEAGWNLIAIALGFNYQLSVYEVSLLELINDQNYPACIEAMCDWPSFALFVKYQSEELKKKELPTTDGLTLNATAQDS